MGVIFLITNRLNKQIILLFELFYKQKLAWTNTGLFNHVEQKNYEHEAFSLEI